MALSPQDVTNLILKQGKTLKFHRLGIASVTSSLPGYSKYRSWINQGYSGSMKYMSNAYQVNARQNVTKFFPKAKTIVIAALAYGKNTKFDTTDTSNNRGSIARYARGQDYHAVFHDKLSQLTQLLETNLGTSVASRICVDSSPLLERELAQSAGLGFLAKNTMLISPGLGSYFLLGELLLEIEAQPTNPLPTSSKQCGQCRQCIDACPTNAFVDEHVLDARRCISYLLIEYSGVIPLQFRDAIGTMLFGCDICQQVCPYNAKAPDRIEPTPELISKNIQSEIPDAKFLLDLGSNQFKRYVQGTALSRMSRTQMRRNLSIVLGNNTEKKQAIELLHQLFLDPKPIVRGHAAWALGKLGAFEHIKQHQETDVYVLSEINAALEKTSYTHNEQPALLEP